VPLGGTVTGDLFVVLKQQPEVGCLLRQALPLGPVGLVCRELAQRRQPGGLGQFPERPAALSTICSAPM
jgi:hypothetical protein